MKKRILFIAGGGASNPILHSQGFPLLQSQENKTYFISYENDLDEFNKYYREVLSEKYPNVEFSPIYLKGTYPLGLENIIKGVRKVLFLYFSKKINIIHARSLLPSLVGMFAKALLFNKISLIYDNRGVVIEEEVFKKVWKENSKKIKIFRSLEKKLLLSADRIVVVSDYFRKYLLKNYPISENKIIFIPNRTNINEQKVIQNRNGKIKVVYSGSTSIWQKIDSVLELFEKIKELNSEIECTIITYRLNEVKKIIKPDLLKKINIITVDSKSVKHELSKHNIGLLIRDNNLINNVASPIKFAEYLQAGLPLLISKGIGDTEEIVKKHNIGVVTDNVELYEDFLKLKSLIEKDEGIYQRCLTVSKEEFDIKDSIDDYNNIYKNILARG